MIGDGSHKPTKILIADDDPAIVDALASRCIKMGFEVDIATNGTQASIKASRNQPDIIFIDVNMPEIDGLSVCARLLETIKAPFDVIVITGNTGVETVESCEAIGAFYGAKGSNFWESITSALSEILPHMADKIATSFTGPVMPTISRVLLVDDDANVGNFLTSRLAKFGLEVLYAATAERGYRMACQSRPSAIVSDYFMPDGDGLWLLQKLRSTPTTKKIPFLVLSGRKLDGIANMALTQDICGQPGAAKVLEKSFDTSELVSALSKYCGFRKGT